MKRKRPTYKRFKPVLHDGSRPADLEGHVEVRVGLKGRLGGHTIYRKGSATLSPAGTDTEEFLPAPAPPSTAFDPALDDNAAASSNGGRPAKVRGFFFYLQVQGDEQSRF